MDEAQRMLAERACERLIVAYAQLIDLGEAAKVAGLFTEDATWESDNRRWVGLDQIRRGFTIRQGITLRKSRHICTNIAIEFSSETEATGVTYFILLRNDDNYGERVAPLDGQFIVGEYRDRFVLTSDGWRFAHRQAKAAFQNKKATQMGKMTEAKKRAKARARIAKPARPAR